MTCDACKNGNHGLHSGAQLGFICIGCPCEWTPAATPTAAEEEAYELTVDTLEDLIATVGVAPREHGIAIRKAAGALVYKIGARLKGELASGILALRSSNVLDMRSAGRNHGLEAAAHFLTGQKAAVAPNRENGSER